MNLAWDRHTHTWDDEMILRTMMLGDGENVRAMIAEVPREKLSGTYLHKHGQLDRKSQAFWGYFFSITPTQKPFTLSSYGPPSRHITS